MALTIVINAFLGYLFVLFVNHIVDLFNELNNFFLGGMIVLIGFNLFYVIARRAMPNSNLTFTHPLNLIGVVSFMGIILLHVFVINLI